MNPSTLQARVIVDELIRGGVREAVLCPGSRNAPLAFALHAADRAGRLRLHVRIDERSAGYLALGLAAASRTPVPIVMTSGTAVANMSPAVFEANYARVPLVVISANRPYELLGSGANQTIEQFGIFGTQVRAAISLGLAEEDLDTNSQWRSAVGRVLAAARGARTGNAGPVQFDIPLREPLVPDAADVPGADLDQIAGGRFAGRPDDRPWTAAPVGRLDIPIEIDLSEPTVVVSGHGAGVHHELAKIGTVAEPTAPLPQNPLHPLALTRLRPTQAIICGRPTLHRSVSALLADPQVRVYALTTGPRWPDVSGNVYATGTRAVVTADPSPEWLSECAQVDDEVRVAVAAELAASPATTGLHVAETVAAAMRPGQQLVVGPSNPIRDLALAGRVADGVRVLSNRGVAGIDGINSTAIGAALAGDRNDAGQTVALLGDLTFIHDVTGLLIGPGEPRPQNLRIVVANDDGGGIFGLLEQGDPRFAGDTYSGAYERIFGTPHRTDLAALCAGFHLPLRRVDLAGLPAALAAPAPDSGIEVLEVATEREPLRDLHARIAARLG